MRANGILSTVEILGSNGGSKFEGAFAVFCRIHGVKCEHTTANIPEFNGVAERALGLVDLAAHAAVVKRKAPHTHSIPVHDIAVGETVLLDMGCSRPCCCGSKYAVEIVIQSEARQIHSAEIHTLSEARFAQDLAGQHDGT